MRLVVPQTARTTVRSPLQEERRTTAGGGGAELTAVGPREVMEREIVCLLPRIRLATGENWFLQFKNIN